MMMSFEAKRRINAMLSAPLERYAVTFNRLRDDSTLAPFGEDVSRSLLDMRENTAPLARPVVVLSGYRGWPLMAARLRDQLVTHTSGEPNDMIAVSYMNETRFDSAVSVAHERIAAWRPDIASGEAEVDLVGVSMGGLVSRALSMGWGGRPALNTQRVFTLASPHRGAKLAEKIAPDPAAKAMLPGSGVLKALDAAWYERRYELTAYAVFDDHWVGEDRTAPPGIEPIRTTGGRIISHLTVSELPGVVADLATRLRAGA